MIGEIKNIIVFIFLGLIISVSSIALESDFLAEFYKSNLINLLITLLAINTATSSIVLTKLKEIGDKNGFDFKDSFKEIKYAIIQQVILIALAIVFSILAESKFIILGFKYHEITFLTLRTAIFLFAIDILWDTAKSIFILLKSN